jgi:hypothetical protein
MNVEDYKRWRINIDAKKHKKFDLLY